MELYKHENWNGSETQKWFWNTITTIQKCENIKQIYALLALNSDTNFLSGAGIRALNQNTEFINRIQMMVMDELGEKAEEFMCEVEDCVNSICEDIFCGDKNWVPEDQNKAEERLFEIANKY